MRITGADVRHIASLARLRMDDAATERFAGELSEILGYVEQLDPGDRGAGSETGEGRRRADEARTADADALIGESAGRDGRVVRVPTVIG